MRMEVKLIKTNMANTLIGVNIKNAASNANCDKMNITLLFEMLI